MGGRVRSWRRSYVGALLLPALLLNGLTLAFAWLSGPGVDELLAEVEVLSEWRETCEHERICLVRVERLVKGESESPVLQVRFPHGVLPEGIGLPGRRHLGDHVPVPGERLFVVLRRDRKCSYSVEHYWLGTPLRAHRAAPSGTATV